MIRPSRQHGFTLIELLTVMVIILILAGIILGLVKYANEKAARAKAEGEIAAISTALESYKTDNGTYPRDAGAADGSTLSATDKLDAKLNGMPGASDTDDYKNACRVLYKAISGDTSGAGTTGVAYGKTYFNVPASEISAKNGTTSRYIVDPFGNCFGYSTANQADTNKGYNPTFDLWSTAGYGPAKAYPTGMAVPDQAALWIKNW